jgi:lipopolysaccharide transport system permease protein
MIVIMRVLWRYRHFVIASVINEFTLRFSRSKFGAAWGILNPIAQVAIYALVLSDVLRAKIGGIDNPYSFALYLSAGMSCWSLFNDIVSKGLNLFIANGNLIKKASFPRVLLLANLVGVCLLDNAMLFLIVFIFYAGTGHVPEMAILLWLPILIFLTATMASGFALILGTLNVFLRDIGQVIPVILQLAFWFTPIVYPINIIPPLAQDLLSFNPVYILVSAYQNILLFGNSPDVAGLAAVAAFVLIVIVTGGWLFGKAGADMADAL